jgi:hypothetical protein
MIQGFTNNPKPETLDWYRAAELKHGRVAMLAALGQIVQHFYTLPDASGVFSAGDRPIEALNKVVAERPLAAIQIGLAIFAVEALGQFNQAKPGQAPGDLGWDPLNLKSDDPEIYAKVQNRELKNGRLAMVRLLSEVFGTGMRRSVRYALSTHSFSLFLRSPSPACWCRRT